MSLYKRGIILVAILAVLGGAYVLLKDRVGGTTEGTVPRSNYEKLIDLKLDDVTRAIVETSEDTFIIDRNPEETNKWILTEPAGIRYDEGAIKAVPLYASSIGTNKIIEEEATDLAQYGLDDPVVITLFTSDGEQHVLHIGNMIPGGESYYMMLPGNMTVSKLESFTAKKILITKNTIRDKILFEIASDEIVSVSMDRDGSRVFESARTSDLDWELNYPIKGNVNLSAISPVLEAVASMTVIDFVEEEPSDLSKYGLSNPAYSISFETAEHVYDKIHLGNEKVKNKEIYAMLDGENDVFTISLEPMGFLDKPLKEIVEVFAYIVNIQDVRKIEVEMDGYKLDLDIDTDPDDKDNDKFYVNGELATMKDDRGKQPFRSYYQALIGVTLAEVLPEAEPEGDAEITFTYYLKKDPGTVEVKFIPKDDRYYYVVKNGEYSGILVNRKKFDEPEGVRDSYNALMEALADQ